MTNGPTPRMKANDVITIGRSRSSHAASVTLVAVDAGLAPRLGELDIEVGVLARQAEEHDENDLISAPNRAESDNVASGAGQGVGRGGWVQIPPLRPAPRPFRASS